MYQPIYVDFNASDEDHAVRIFPPFTTVDFQPIDLEPTEGLKLWVSDGEIEMKGNLTFRDGIWVVVPDKNGFKDVDPSAPYHINNINRK